MPHISHAAEVILSLKKLVKKSRTEYSLTTPRSLEIVHYETHKDLHSVEELNDHRFRELVIEFAREQYAEENFFLWDEVVKYKKLTSAIERRDCILRICNHYATRVNLNSKVLQHLDILKMICQSEHSWKHLCDNSLFIVEQSVSENIMDVVGRFVNTEAYKLYKNQVKMENIVSVPSPSRVILGSPNLSFHRRRSVVLNKSELRASIKRKSRSVDMGFDEQLRGAYVLQMKLGEVLKMK
jgi:hypothetical protein